MCTQKRVSSGLVAIGLCLFLATRSRSTHWIADESIYNHPGVYPVLLTACVLRLPDGQLSHGRRLWGTAMSRCDLLADQQSWECNVHLT